MKPTVKKVERLRCNHLEISTCNFGNTFAALRVPRRNRGLIMRTTGDPRGLDLVTLTNNVFPRGERIAPAPPAPGKYGIELLMPSNAWCPVLSESDNVRQRPVDARSSSSFRLQPLLPPQSLSMTSRR